MYLLKKGACKPGTDTVGLLSMDLSAAGLFTDVGENRGNFLLPGIGNFANLYICRLLAKVEPAVTRSEVKVFVVVGGGGVRRMH